eukprot:CAMPEP_0183830992 /NCGR_PEP_ID=MMETSP0807_2-20130328/4353_1 /TAXON_ID=88271 /ORGANISM="Picocystis salinarum, Strain CCMP1897" /LENGTH=1211 /DNA_ID=CAMNT_0026076395 /DNA_START=511 /DNA_END=4146 /DNA_ORIENTATION=+
MQGDRVTKRNKEDHGMWEFWIDRGGTFTDIVACSPECTLHTHKLLSENPEQYKDAALAGIRHFLCTGMEESIPGEKIRCVKMGTTVATNALLERKGDRVALFITKGFRDALRIAYQNRPKLFAREIVLPELLYEQVIEVEERVDRDGRVLVPLNEDALEVGLKDAFDRGIRACAIVFMHGYQYKDHEQKAAALAQRFGFTQVSTSHEASPLIKLVGRGDTAVVDAYLSPILRRYVNQVAGELGNVRIQFMQSNGGLTEATLFQGKDAILSGPAGGIVAATATAASAGFDKLITFDMGGTSTDVAHFAGTYDRAFDTLVAGVRIRAPMMEIHTVAAGGGSICFFDGARYRVGPESAGANPGPAAYRRGGPLTVTDCNVMMGRLQPGLFPAVFGPNQDEQLDVQAVREKFLELAKRIEKDTGDARPPEAVAEGFLMIAVQNMANAVKKISVQRGYDVTRYTLVSFGGAGGQHACRVADALGMTSIFIHAFGGVLSAYGMGLADVRALRECTVELVVSAEHIHPIATIFDKLEKEAMSEVTGQQVDANCMEVQKSLMIRYQGTDTALSVPFSSSCEDMAKAFEDKYHQQFGFAMPERQLIADTAVVEVIGRTFGGAGDAFKASEGAPSEPQEHVHAFFEGEWQDVPVFARTKLVSGQRVHGPALILEDTGTNVVEYGWEAVLHAGGLLISRTTPLSRKVAIGTECDPIYLEVFNNLFMSIAEQMGYTLQNTSYSVNMKERLDFSCAIFDPLGNLIANAPHMPVHLGSMGESIREVIRQNQSSMQAGDVYVLNDPYRGGTHLPDVTVVSPVFDEGKKNVIFYVGSRGHHADIGGITPASMPPNSKTVDEEGVLITNFKLVDGNTFQEDAFRNLLTSAKFPARDPDTNLADIRAQIAANEKGIRELRKMVDSFGLETVQAYMKHVQDNAEEAVRRAIGALKSGSFVYELDDGSKVCVQIDVDSKARSAKVDFTGTSAQLESNFNAPSAVCRAAVMYVFRTLVEDEIPMNEGCLKAIDIIIPVGTMLNPVYPAAVVAGNVETSQVVTDALYGALGVMAAAQGTMNNLTFGNKRYQYYETVCGGSGAGPTFNGTDAVHTHMTNSRMTDPEVLELRYPVILENFEVRRGSGGIGKFKGGDGITRRIRFLEEMEVIILSNRRLVPPYGMAGGHPGECGKNWVERSDGKRRDLGSCDSIIVQPGDVFVMQTPSGGGFGNPQ